MKDAADYAPIIDARLAGLAAGRCGSITAQASSDSQNKFAICALRVSSNPKSD
jgi:hypothetical protein